MSSEDSNIRHLLGERVKELNALHQAAHLLQDDALDLPVLLGQLILLLPPAFQFPELTGASIRYGEVERSTSGFSERHDTLTGLFQTNNGGEGVLRVSYRKPTPVAVEGPFLTEERSLVNSLCEMLRSALDRRANHAELTASRHHLTDALQSAKAQRDRTQLLLEVANAVTTQLDLAELLVTISRLLRQTMSHHYASVTLWDHEARQLRRHAVVFPNRSGVIKAGALVPRDSPSDLAYHRGETMTFTSANVEGLDAAFKTVMKDEHLRSVCCVPLQTSRARHGVINVARPEDGEFPADDVRLLEQIARQLAIAIENAVAFKEISDLKNRLAEEKLYLEEEITGQRDIKGITGSSKALREVLEQVRTVAPTDATVLLLGETGTGKEVIANAIHEGSRRQGQTFVRVNAAALPAALFESELFGYEKGAFTGAVGTKIGRLELAHRGTLFLDEIGDMPLELQPKLLRALQEHEFERLGSTRTQRVDVRLVAATNRNLEEMVDAGAFRSDLYYRLSVFPIRLPPLRDRPEDIPPLVRHFVQKLSREMGRAIETIPAVTMGALEKWHWPGNIRELQNVIERAVILSKGSALQLPASALRPSAHEPVVAAAAPVRYADGEREIILRALRDTKGRIAGPAGAAARLGLKRTTLHSKMQRLGITRQGY